MTKLSDDTIIPEAEIEALGKKFFSADDLEEIQAQIDTHQESIDYDIENYGVGEDQEPLTFYEAFRQMWDHAEAVAFSSLEEPKFRRQARKVFDRCQEFALLIGVYREISDEDYRNAYVFGGSKASCFPKIKGVRCEYVGNKPRGRSS